MQGQFQFNYPPRYAEVYTKLAQLAAEEQVDEVTVVAQLEPMLSLALTPAGEVVGAECVQAATLQKSKK